MRGSLVLIYPFGTRLVLIYEPLLFFLERASGLSHFLLADRKYLDLYLSLSGCLLSVTKAQSRDVGTTSSILSFESVIINGEHMGLNIESNLIHIPTSLTMMKTKIS
jgi:hypothetical protein